MLVTRGTRIISRHVSNVKDCLQVSCAAPDVERPVSAVRVGRDLVVEVELVPQRAEALGVRGWDPLVDGDSAGVEVPAPGECYLAAGGAELSSPLEHDALPLPGPERVGAVQHHVLQRPVLDDGRHHQPLQSHR